MDHIYIDVLPIVCISKYINMFYISINTRICAFLTHFYLFKYSFELCSRQPNSLLPHYDLPMCAFSKIYFK